MLLLERAGGRKSGGPPLLAPSFKVQRNTAHNQSSGFAVAPGLQAITRADLYRSRALAVEHQETKAAPEPKV
jgi:hypothetical protein